MRFLVDAQLPSALARWLKNRGHSADHVADLQMAAAKDTDIWIHAKATAAVLISKDEDFAILSLADPKGPVVIWLRTGNTTRRTLISGFERLLPRILDQIESGEKLIEVV